MNNLLRQKRRLKTTILIASKPIILVEELRVDRRRFSKDDYVVDHKGKMSNRIVLFRIPFTIYFLCWDKDVRKFLFATEQYHADVGYYFKFLS